MASKVIVAELVCESDHVICMSILTTTSMLWEFPSSSSAVRVVSKTPWVNQVYEITALSVGSASIGVEPSSGSRMILVIAPSSDVVSAKSNDSSTPVVGPACPLFSEVSTIPEVES